MKNGDNDVRISEKPESLPYELSLRGEIINRFRFMCIKK